MAGIFVWGYKPSGESCLFEVPTRDHQLPDGWSSDVMVIRDPGKRTAESITDAGGVSVAKPVKIGPPPDAAPDESINRRGSTIRRGFAKES